MDILVVESGNGGDVVLRSNDLVRIEGFENMPYLGMFGGNVENDNFNRTNLDQLLSVGFDIKVIETDNGGDVSLLGNDIETIETFDNMPYLSMFGGNPGFISSSTELINKQNFDWWGNNLLMENQPKNQFNSYTEEAFKINSLDDKGIAKINNAISKDLSFLSFYGEIQAVFEIVSVDKVKTVIELKSDIQSNENIDWWGNNLLMENNPSIQFISSTEKSFENVNISSAGRIILEQIISKDLDFMKEFAPLKVDVSITGIDSVEIILNLQEPTNQQNRKYQYLWEGTQAELLIASFNISHDSSAFDFSFEISFN